MDQHPCYHDYCDPTSSNNLLICPLTTTLWINIFLYFVKIAGYDNWTSRHPVRGRIFQMSPSVSQRVSLEASRVENSYRDLAPKY